MNTLHERERERERGREGEREGGGGGDLTSEFSFSLAQSHDFSSHLADWFVILLKLITSVTTVRTVS